MKLLLDECVPRRLKREFPGHEVFTIDEANFKGLKNGNLLGAAEGEFDVPVTVDKNMEHQQNKSNLPPAIVVLSAFSNRFESLLPLIPKTLRSLENIKTGEIVIISEK